MQRRSSKILPGQCPISKRFLLSDARYIALPSIIDSLASPPPQGKLIKLIKPWNNEVWNGNSESSAICQYVCQSVLFVQPIRSFNLISMLVHCLHMKITTCLLVLINQLRKWDNSFSCELVSSLSAYESCLIYLEQSCQSCIIPMTRMFDEVSVVRNNGPAVYFISDMK